MLTSYVIDCDMNVHIHVQILLSYLQPVHLILGLERHQLSPQTPSVSYVYFDKTKQGCMSLIHSA